MRISRHFQGKWIYPVLIIVIIIGVTLVLPFKLPYSISSYCQIHPAKKWVLTMGTDGQLLSTVFDFRNGISEGVRASQFAREGTMRLVLNSLVSSGGQVEIGDTIATIYSSETEESIADIKGQLAIMQASLASTIKGDKESVISEYEAKLVQAEEAAANQKLILDRLKALLEKNLTSRQEYEVAEGEEKLLLRDVEIARSQLESARTGAKPEEVEKIKVEIAALEDQLEVLNKRVESFSIISPISGVVSRSYSPDTLLVIADITNYVATIPMKANESFYTALDEKVSIDYNGNRDINGWLIHLDSEIRIMEGKQTRYGTVLIDNYQGELPLGILSKCTISCKPVTIREYLKRFLIS